eukprot:1803340-Amphidinium_carterae.1
MLRIVCPSHCIMYRNHMAKLNDRYGQAVWGLLYQTDVRARKEHMIRVLRRLTELQDMGGAPYGFTEDRPWNAVWRYTVEDDAFWSDEFREQASLILAHST